MIAQIVFDLPIDGPFDYLIPEPLVAKVVMGMRVKASFGPKVLTGYVVGLIAHSDFPKLKSVLSLSDSFAVFNNLDLSFAKGFCAYYGCSLGEALTTILRNKAVPKPSIQRDHKPSLSLYRCHPHGYADKIQEIMDGYRRNYQDTAGDYCHFLILVPDSFRAQTLSEKLKVSANVKIGARSMVFECDGQHDCVIMVDGEDASYKQEQTPMYDTTQVLLMRSKIYGIDLAFVGISPSVEVMSLVQEKEIKLLEGIDPQIPLARLVDLTNYKFVPGLISPPVRDVMETALKAGKKSVLLLNRKGSYRMTRCTDCGEVLKCSHCDSSLIFSRSEKKYLCRHCTFTLPGDTICPKCHKPSWKSVGIGVEQVQAELKKCFPQARILSFERTMKNEKKSVIAGDRRERSNVLSLENFDILISTSAFLRFQGKWQVSVAAFIDFDAELNRLDMRSAFNAFSLILHVGSMAQESVFIQTRNISHYVLQNISKGKVHRYYDEELKLRKEFGFSPYQHWIKISWRGKSEKSAHLAAEQVYNALSKSVDKDGLTITPPMADAVGRKRDQFRFNVMVQTDQVPHAMAFIKSTMAETKRQSRVFVTLNIDP